MTPRPAPPPSLVPPALAPVLAPVAALASRGYGRAITARNRRYDRGRGVVTMDRPVVAVGNLSVGGTGKTPAVQALCRWLIDAGHTPAIAMRGYAPRGGESDEAALHARALPGTPIAVGADRVRALIDLFSTPRGEVVDVVVLDDGFQHRRLARQLDVVLIDARTDPHADRLLPAGRLREPVSSLARAHAVVITHADHADAASLESRLRADYPHLVLARARHHWQGLLAHRPDGVEEPVQPHSLRGRRYVLACAIGNPGAFVAQAQGVLGPPAATLLLPDHDPYQGRTLARLLRLAREGTALVVTEKDWIKLADRAIDWPCPVVRPRLAMAFDRGERALRERVLTAALWQDQPDEPGHADSR